MQEDEGGDRRDRRKAPPLIPRSLSAGGRALSMGDGCKSAMQPLRITLAKDAAVYDIS